MDNCHKFFCNRECKYFPCHTIPDDKDGFNCLFCYCPLYLLGDKCGGRFRYDKNIKICTDCHLPHMPEYYETITAKMRELIYT
ncbi:MAG: cysteine-rich small domain-containing protein [Oscillospiraceae bacterium]|nr:cysteine-rich small domain-containing protein [Oscillospiraceae bacterium]